MKTKNKTASIDKKTNFFYLILVFAFILATIFTYQRTIILHNYSVVESKETGQSVIKETGQ